MRIKRLLEIGALGVIAVLTLGSGCPLKPEIKDKLIQLAAAGSVSDTLHALGSINVDDQIDDFSAAVDVADILHKAGIDADAVDDIKLSGVSYKVAIKDPDDSRQIQNGTVEIKRGGGAFTPLVTNFNETVNTVTTFKTAPLDPAGVTLLNGLLADALENVKHGTLIPNPQITYHFSGTSAPTPATTNFYWVIKVDISIIGKVKIKTIG
jgi:hypothetical protein